MAKETTPEQRAAPVKGAKGSQTNKVQAFIPGTSIPWPELDVDWQKLHWSFQNNQFIHGGEQIVLSAGDKVVVGFFDPFALKFSPFARFSAVLTKEEATELADELYEMANKKK